tara:strand:+ start:30 stop:173 length:144 start_codon:yes stop_codon:yes gene_type:complete
MIATENNEMKTNGYINKQIVFTFEYKKKLFFFIPSIMKILTKILRAG